eukprot:761100-Hanusia_phi.AAC.1
MRVGYLRRLLHFHPQSLPGLCSVLEEAVGVSVEDVALDAAGEEHGLLPDQRQHAVQPRVVQLANLHVVKADAAGGGLVEVLEEVEDGALAGSRGSDDGRDVARGNLERNVVEGGGERLAGRVGEGDVLESDLALDLRELDQPAPLDPGPPPQQLEHFGTCSCALDEVGEGVEKVGEVLLQLALEEKTKRHHRGKGREGEEEEERRRGGGEERKVEEVCGGVGWAAWGFLIRVPVAEGRESLRFASGSAHLVEHEGEEGGGFELSIEDEDGAVDEERGLDTAAHQERAHPHVVEPADGCLPHVEDEMLLNAALVPPQLPRLVGKGEDRPHRPQHLLRYPVRLRQRLLHHLRVLAHPGRVEAVNDGDDRDDAAGEAGKAPAAEKQVSCDTPNTHERFDGEAEDPRQIVGHLGAVGGGVVERGVLEEEVAEEVDAEGADQPLLGVAEEEDAPEVEEGVDDGSNDEADDIRANSIGVLVDQSSDGLTDKVRQGEGEREADEKSNTSCCKP